MFLDNLPQLPYTLKAILILASGVLLLRLAGKRSIAQLTVPEAILMIAVGTILIQPLGEKNEWRAIYGGSLLIAGMVFLSYLQIHFPKFRNIVYGVPSTLVENGKILVENLRKCRMTTDQLEMRLRQLQVEDLSNVKLAILEPSGNLSVIQKEQKKNAEKQDIQLVLNMIQNLDNKITKLVNGQQVNFVPPNIVKPKTDKLFEEAHDEDIVDSNLPLH